MIVGTKDKEVKSRIRQPIVRNQAEVRGSQYNLNLRIQ